MVKQLTRSAVRIYGALTALGNGSANVLEGLLPFFDPVLRQRNGAKLDPHEIAAAVRETYPWNFNADLVEAFVPYLERQGWIVADVSSSASTTTYTIQVPEHENSDAEATIEIELRKIAEKFKAFAEELSPLTAIPKEVEEFEDILVEWLLFVEAFSDKSIDFRTDVRRDEGGTLRRVLHVPSTTSLADEEKFLCARFVKHAIEVDQAAGELLARIAAIGLLTEVVQDFVKPVTAIEQTDLVVYLDAPVAMELLGLSGKLARDNTAPVVAELLRMGASVRIFGQSIDEMKNSLQAVLKNPHPTGPTAQALIRREVLKEYVVEASVNPVPLLEGLGVKVAYRTKEQTPSEHSHFDAASWQELYGKLSYADNPRAREHDTDVATFVIRQRKGRTSNDIFKSNAVALTRNGLLAQIVRKMYTSRAGMPPDAVAPVIHRRVMVMAMWLRTGMGASDLNMPKRLLLASCEHVLAIRPGVVEAVRRFTEALGDEDKARQLDLLVSQDRSAQALMDKTLGIASVVTADSFPALWDEMLHPHLEEERQKSREEVKRVASEGRKKLTEANRRVAAAEEREQRGIAVRDDEIRQLRTEDRNAIEALCLDVRSRLMRGRLARGLVAIVIAGASCVPLALETTPWVRVAAIVFGFGFAYLTATGGKLLSLQIDEGKALAALQKVAKNRRLTSKLQQFDIRWINDAFVVADRPADGPITRTDLLT